MLGIPLHPLVVHFPIVLSILLPISVVAALWAIRKGATPRRVWPVPLAVAAALTLSAFVATETGENEEERVEQVVARRAIHGHEEAAERFLVLSGVLLVVAAGGLLPRTAGRAARLVTAAGALGLVAAGVQVGHSGGTLVYREGAASAYVDSSAATARRDGVAAARDSVRTSRGDDEWDH
ncbi:MAG TPA: transglutaminaseTgpA domain-containing protein [Gemmatimonadaceae bacterium]|nr:transglutaminaseTgpA domain-containing protein [Gemmatimonadaceae bacterium]